MITTHDLVKIHEYINHKCYEDDSWFQGQFVAAEEIQFLDGTNYKFTTNLSYRRPINSEGEPSSKCGVLSPPAASYYSRIIFYKFKEEQQNTFKELVVKTYTQYDEISDKHCEVLKRFGLFVDLVCDNNKKLLITNKLDGIELAEYSVAFCHPLIYFNLYLDILKQVKVLNEEFNVNHCDLHDSNIVVLPKKKSVQIIDFDTISDIKSIDENISIDLLHLSSMLLVACIMMKQQLPRQYLNILPVLAMKMVLKLNDDFAIQFLEELIPRFNILSEVDLNRINFTYNINNLIALISQVIHTLEVHYSISPKPIISSELNRIHSSYCYSIWCDKYNEKNPEAKQHGYAPGALLSYQVAGSKF